jgi:hypothetical protein
MRSGPGERAHAQASAPLAVSHGSSAPAVSWGPRITLLMLPLPAAGLLIAAEFSALYDIRVVTAVPAGGSFSTGGHHGNAQAVIAIGIAVMALAAVLGGSRAAAVALLVLATAALAIALLIDLPDVHETGLIGRTYESARAEPRAGLYLEIAGGCAALAGATLILSARSARHASRRSGPSRE